MRHFQRALPIFWLLVLGLLLAGTSNASAPQALVTVSGTITDPEGGPVPNVWVAVNSPLPNPGTTTNASGFYSLTIQTTGQLMFCLRPPASTRLALVNYSVDGVTASYTQNFTLTRGYLLQLQLNADGGAWLAAKQMIRRSTSESYGLERSDEASHRYQAVLPPDIYYVTARDVTAGYLTTQVFDLRTADQSAAMALNTALVNPFPYEPPDASKITFGPPDDLGEAVVTGAPGAALPLAHVLLVNLNSTHQAHAISESDGSFTARVFAPPGSAVMVKHGPDRYDWPFRWGDLETGIAFGVEPFPGTIINLPPAHAGGSGATPFAGAGAIDYFVDDLTTTRNYVGAAWSMTGTTPTRLDPFAPGDEMSVQGIIRLQSQAITVTTPLSSITAGGSLWLWMIADGQGRPLAAQNAFMSTLLTPSGLPIQGGQQPTQWLNATFQVTNLRYAGGHGIEGDFTVTGRLPTDLPAGTYSPNLRFDFSGVPTSTQWLAANVVRYIYAANAAVLPPIRVGNAAAPRLIWRLLMDDPVQGTRGAGARQDKGYFELSSDIVSQGAAFTSPPVDALTGQPITYRLEPFLPMISFTDRRIPAPPLLPLDLPGGRLSVQIEQPDGTVRDLGSEPFAQSFHRTRTTRGGYDVNGGTIQLDDVYSLMTASDRFRVAFDQYGHHVITMTGVVSDVWGNAYTGGGVYDLWVAHPLDIDPGVLPATPFEVGDAFNPSLSLSPGVPADVSMTLTLYPNSNPVQAITRTIQGRANNYGHFSLSPNQPITLSLPGEYRVDLTATYTDSAGRLYLGAMVWGGVVETPNSPLVAHGRRGLDSLTYIPPAWFVSRRDLTIRPGAVSHSLNPYFNGDIIWSRMSDMPWGGDALLMGASIQDTVGTIAAAIRPRAEQLSFELSPPGSLEERFAAGEIPLLISTCCGRWPQMVPSEIDQMAYSYRTSQRPGVRVREVVADDSQTGGYWRLDTLYDDQLSVGILGDLPNDFKFQYVGAVYRDLVAGINQYAIQGSLWVFIPDDDPVGSRVMPPFAGPGNGGWTQEGGPILKLKGKDIHIFISPTGTMPGAVLEAGDTFRFAGHIAPTLNSKVAITVTSPSGVKHQGGGQANKIGYYYDPADDFAVTEPGAWSVDVRVWHDGTCSGGQTVPPYPSGDVLGSEDGRYWFYVVPKDAPRLNVASPMPGFLTFGDTVTPITITGRIPVTLTNTTVDYTTTMPGYILKHGQATISGTTYTIVFDPAALSADFPNLDLKGRDDLRPGLADTFSIGLLLRGQGAGGNPVYQANTVTLQGNQVFVGGAAEPTVVKVFLPVVLRH